MLRGEAGTRKLEPGLGVGGRGGGGQVRRLCPEGREECPWPCPPHPQPALSGTRDTQQAGGQAGGQAGLRARMLKVSTCGGFHLSPAATTAAAAGSDPPPCWPLTCCRQEGDVVTDRHETHPPRPSRLPWLRLCSPLTSKGGRAGAQEGTSSSLAPEHFFL